MIIIAGKSNPNLARAIGKALKSEVVYARTKKFADQELRIEVERNCTGKKIVILQSTSHPVNDHLIELLLIAQTIKRMHAQKIIALVPYFGYSRQDKSRYNYGPVSVQLIAHLMQTAGIDKVITIDLHSKKSEQLFTIEIDNLSSGRLCVPYFEKIKNAIVICPDGGALSRAHKLAALLKTHLVSITKTRTINGIIHTHNLAKNVKSKNCIIIDDIIDTGTTLCQAADQLYKQGARSVSCFATHGVFSESCFQKISSVGFEKVYITDTIQHHNLPSWIQVLSCESLIIQALKKEF